MYKTHTNGDLPRLVRIMGGTFAGCEGRVLMIYYDHLHTGTSDDIYIVAIDDNRALRVLSSNVEVIDADDKRKDIRQILRAHTRRNPRQRVYVRELIAREDRRAENEYVSASYIIRKRLEFRGAAELWPRCLHRRRFLDDWREGTWVAQSGRMWTPKGKAL